MTTQEQKMTYDTWKLASPWDEAPHNYRRDLCPFCGGDLVPEDLDHGDEFCSVECRVQAEHEALGNPDPNMRPF